MAPLGFSCAIIARMSSTRHKKVFLLILGITLAFLSAILYLRYRLREENSANQTLLKNIGELQVTLRLTEERLAEVTKDSASLLDALSAEQVKSVFLAEQASTFSIAVQRLSGTVTNLEKLQKTDPELLIKYSKVNFLNEHYTSENLTLLPKEYAYESGEEYFHARALPYLENLIKESKNAGVELRIISAFRSFETQKDLKSQYKVVYGTGANKFSAEQGYSEHQLGTTVDFTTPILGATFAAFDSTPEFRWLGEHAHRFGFILSYPKDNAYYIYEPWHWRFVGIELATKLKGEGRQFYDMDQRELNEYLVKIFD